MDRLVSRQEDALKVIGEVNDLLLGEFLALRSVLLAHLEADFCERRR